MKYILFFMKLNNETVRIVLKNATVVQGTIMKLTLKDNNSVTLDHLSVRGSNPIRKPLVSRWGIGRGHG
ncbi:hypothetical protein MKX03_014847 [Papaver bracteatum]|nr:hypothetical protein MKX03_014847 [Papaver bracteatum]